MMLLVGTFFFAIASALIPVVNAEVYLTVVAAKAHSISAWQLAAYAAAGQTIGKLIWYYAGANSIRIPWIHRKMKTKKWRQNYDIWHARTTGKPVIAGGLTLLSAYSGFPPLAVFSVLAGALRMQLWVFIPVVFVGRWLRFWTILAGVGLLFT